MSRRGRLLLALFAGLLFLPLVQMATGIVPEGNLAGTERVKRLASPKIKTWLNGMFQKRFERWFEQRLGFRSVLVRTDNQINFTVFGKTAGDGGTKVLVGRDGWLYEGSYVLAYNRRSGKNVSQIARRVAAVKHLQDELARRGIPLLLVIAPSKPEIYPEHAAEGMLKPGREKRQTAYDLAMPLLEKAGVNVLDVPRLFLEQKYGGGPLLFPRAGSHWSHYGAALAVSEMLRSLGEVAKRDFGALAITGVTTDRQVWLDDNDLGNLLNLWTSPKVSREQVHPVLAPRPAAPRPPNVLLVGDSFNHMVSRILIDNRLISRHDFLYYFKRRYTYPRRPAKQFARADIDWAQELLGRDAVIVEINQARIPEFGYGFVEAALEGLAKVK